MRWIGNFIDSIDLAFADEATKDEFWDFRWRYPWATYEDWWDYQAYVQSRGALPNPMNSQDWAFKRSAWGFGGETFPKPNQHNPHKPR